MPSLRYILTSKRQILSRQLIVESLPFIQNAQDRREIWVDDIYLGVVTILRIFTILTLDEKSNQMYICRQIRPKSEPLDPTLSKKSG